MKKKVLVLVFALAVFVLYEIIFVLPSPFYEGREELPEKFSSREIVFNLLEEKTLNDECRGVYEGFIRENPYGGGCLVTLGKAGWAVETREGFIARKKVRFSVNIEKGDLLKFSVGVSKDGFSGKIFANGKKIFEKNLKPPEIHDDFLFNRFLKHFYFDFKPLGGYWKDYEIEFDKAYGKLEFEVVAGKGFFGNFFVLRKNKSKRLNIILIQVDALRRDLVGKGYFKTIDMLKKNGFYFKNSFSNSNWTRPSNISQFYSRLSSELFISPDRFHIFPLEKKLFYSEKRENIIRILKNNGYLTGFVGNNVFLHGFSSVGVDVGFGSYLDFENQKYETEYILEHAQKWIKNTEGTPFFLFIDFNKSHTPYKPRIDDIDFKEFLRNPRFSLYKATIKRIDKAIKKLFVFLEKSNLLENTILIINSDHGEVFGNYGRYYITQKREKKKIWNHGSTLRCEEIKIPVIFYFNDKFKGSYDGKFELMDIAPTILGLLGIKNNYGFRGKDFSDVILGKKKNLEDRYIFVEGKGEKAVVNGEFEYIKRGVKGKNELYNIWKDKDCLSPFLNYKIEKRMNGLMKSFPEKRMVFYLSFKEAGDILEFNKGFKPIYIYGYGNFLYTKNKLYFGGKRGEIFIFFKDYPLYFKTLLSSPLVTSLVFKGKKKFFKKSEFEVLKTRFPYNSFKKGYFVSFIPYESAININFRDKKETLISKGVSNLLKEWGYKK